MISLAAFASLLTLAGQANVNPIDDLVHSLGPGGIWLNGVAPIVNLPKGATSAQIFEETARNSIFEEGQLRVYRIIEDRKTPIDPPMGSNLHAILATTNLGPKILLYIPGQVPGKEGKFSYWTRFRDVKPGWSAPESQIDVKYADLLSHFSYDKSAKRTIPLIDTVEPELVLKTILEHLNLMTNDKSLIQIRYLHRSTAHVFKDSIFEQDLVFEFRGKPAIVHMGATGGQGWEYICRWSM